MTIPKISKPKLPHGIWSKKRYRYPILTFLVFGLIYLLFNLPVFYARYTYTPPQTVKTVVTTQEVVQKKMADSAVLLPGETIPLQSTISIPKIN
ncbi:MAG: hypothetical protein M1426_02250, partial [Patescibacteria group bacterium]|nr:hypothetical protein [Patescibacteria group bacterium]